MAKPHRTPPESNDTPRRPHGRPPTGGYASQDARTIALRRAIERAPGTLRELARAAQVSHVTLVRVRNGQTKKVTLDVVQRVARALEQWSVHAGALALSLDEQTALSSRAGDGLELRAWHLGRQLGAGRAIKLLGQAGDRHVRQLLTQRVQALELATAAAAWPQPEQRAELEEVRRRLQVEVRRGRPDLTREQRAQLEQAQHQLEVSARIRRAGLTRCEAEIWLRLEDLGHHRGALAQIARERRCAASTVRWHRHNAVQKFKYQAPSRKVV